jgi:fructose-1-phosphate kinase PfkB-like protein
MVNAEVIKGVNQLLVDAGIQPKPDESFGDFVARGLGISARQAEVLLSALHDGATVDDAVLKAGIEPGRVDQDLLKKVARLIGTTLGNIASKIS